MKKAQWGGVSVGKALARVQVPNTYTKSQAQCCASEIEVWCGGEGGVIVSKINK